MAAPKNQPLERAKYRAFISYSHKDKAIATWLHTALESFRMPKKLVGSHTSLGIVPKRLTPIFRDQDELPASGDLGSELERALSNSLFLIVICSPASAQSKWVNQEIRRFKMLHGSNKVLALIVDGEPNAQKEASEQECFAPALKFVVNDNGDITDTLSEPIAADLRKHAEGKRLATLKLISGLTGLRLDDLVQREAARRMQTLVYISVASLFAAVFAVGLALYANDRRLDANTQRAIAEQEAENAKAVSDFLVQSFDRASSTQDNPNAVTARSILDGGAKRLNTDLKDQPLIQSRLSSTIARAFNNLGLFKEAIEVVDSTAAISGIELPSAFLVKADALLRTGDLNAAMETIKYVQALFELESSIGNNEDSPQIRSTIARIQASIYYNRGQHAEGLKFYEVALRELESMPKPDMIAIVQVLQARALLLSDLGEMESANADLERAMTIALENVDNTDILISYISLAQAQVNFLTWNLELALKQINMALLNMQRILENDNPLLADAISMKGQILHAMGELDEAYISLTTAVEVYNKAYGGRHYLSGIAEVYLGLIAGDRKDLPVALAHFEEAKLHYDESYGEIHANHGDLLVNQASVLASNGELQRANQDCAAGMLILEDTLGKDSAFTQQLQAVCDEIKQQ
jgi:tetratricopeptide (TPR) repeat protein